MSECIGGIQLLALKGVTLAETGGPVVYFKQLTVLLIILLLGLGVIEYVRRRRK